MAKIFFRTLFTLSMLPVFYQQLLADPVSDQNPTGQISTEQNQSVAPKKADTRNVWLEAKAAYFFPENSRFDKVFGGGGIYGLELSVQAWRNIYGWASTSAFYKSGHSYGYGTPATTNMFLLPIGLGLKYAYPIKFVDLWIGAGALGTWMRVAQHASTVTPVICKWGAGGIVKAGILFHIKKGFFVDIFSDYSFMTIPYHNNRHGTVKPHNANLNGWSLGASIGWSFGSRLK